MSAALAAADRPLGCQVTGVLLIVSKLAVNLSRCLLQGTQGGCQP